MGDFKPIGQKQIRKQSFGICSGDILNTGDLVAVAPCTGLICVTNRENGINSQNRPLFSILHPDGTQISSIKWNSGQIICLFWSFDREVINVMTDNGKLLQYDIHCQLTRQLTICSEEILEGKSFTHRDTGRHCVVYITTTCRFSFMADCDDPNRITELGQLHGENLPDSWTICYQKNDLVLVAFFGSLFVLRGLNGYGGGPKITENLRLTKNFNCVTVLTSSLDGKYMAASTDSGIHAIIDSETMDPIAEMNTAGKITQSPLQVAFVAMREDPIVALLWHHMLLIFDKAKHWVRYDIDEVTSIHAEIDGVRMVSGSSHDFLSMVDNSTAGVYSPGDPGNLLVDSFHFFQQEDERAEEIISTLRDQDSQNGALLPIAVGQCTLAATAEFNISKQKEFLFSASFGKTLTDEVDCKLFARTNRILRVLNHLRHHSAIYITYSQFVKIGPFGVIDRLLSRNEHQLCWHIANHLQLVEDQPNVKEKIFSSWAQSVVRGMTNDHGIVENEQITARIRQRTSQLGVSVNFIEIAQQAAEMGNVNLAYKLIECEVRFKPRVELLLKIDASGEKALQCALESHDPDLIYLSLLHIHAVSSADDYQQILRKYPTAANQYAIYCRDNNRKIVGQFKTKRDESFYLATIQLKNAENTNDADECIESLNNASKTFKMNPDPQSQFAHRSVEFQKVFMLKCDENQVPVQHTKTARTAIKYLLENGQYAKAEQMKRDLKFNEINFYRLKIISLGRKNEFGEIEKISKSKKPPVGLDFFIKVCMNNGKPVEAEKYLSRMTGKQRINGLLEMRRYIDAADVANALGDIDLVEKCYNIAQQNDIAAANEISSRYA